MTTYGQSPMRPLLIAWLLDRRGASPLTIAVAVEVDRWTRSWAAGLLCDEWRRAVAMRRGGGGVG